MPPINILHLHASFDTGEAAMRSIRLINGFGDRARHVIVSGAPDRLGARAAIGAGIRYEIAQDAPSLSGAPSVARYEALARFMRRFDLVLTHDWGAIDGVMARRVFAKGAPPLVHHEDELDAEEAGGRKIERDLYRRLALPAAHALAVPSRALEEIARRRWKLSSARIRRIAGGVDPGSRAARPDPGAIPGFRRKPGEVVIGTVAPLRPDKDLPALVRAVGGVSARVRLVIVGDGPDRGRIEDTAEAMGMADRVHLPGAIADPRRYIGLFDIVALASANEQLPTLVLEAMAAGLPVVAPRIGDIQLMLGPANAGYILPRGEVALRDALQAMAACGGAERARIGAENRDRAVAEFHEKAMIRHYAALYDDAMGRPGALG